MKTPFNEVRIAAALAIFSLLISGHSIAQEGPNHTPNSVFDTIFDKYGNKVPIANIYIPTAKFGTAQVQSIIVSTCQAGYFTLHFETGSVFDLSSSARTVACKVFEDISNLITSTIAAGAVQIHCGTPTGSGLAEASPYFIFPSNLANQNQGIIDGQVYKAIVSGTNPYLTLPLSLNNANQIYHGFVNAVTLGTVNPWNYNVNTTSIASNEYDMYSVLLHEAMHSLGFLSLMRFDGLSAFTPTIVNFPYYNYYHRYDLFLHDHNNNPLLAAPVGSCAISGLTFAPSSYSVIGQGMATCTVNCPQDISTCSVAAKYIGSTTATVYTPYYYEPGSSLSHFEDMCCGTYTGSCIPFPSSPGNNNLYFNMSNFTDKGSCFVKRHPTPEERLVLCDLGYSVNTTYGGSAVAGSSYTYTGGTCSPSNIVGHNDGYFNGQFTLQVVALSTTVIPFSTLLANDNPSVGLSVSCMELVTNNANLTLGSNDFTVTVNPGGGLVVLKYVPRNGSGQIGNATFVFINFVPPGCNSCGIVNNGGFEYSTPGQNNCGFLQNAGAPLQPRLDCWQVYGSNYTADLLTTVCPSISLELGVITRFTAPPINTVALGASSNTNAIGLLYATNGATGAVVNTLNAPLVNGQTYQISFWALNYGSGVPNTNINSAGNPMVLTLASATSAPNPFGLATPGFPNGVNVLANFTVAASKTWSLVTATFVYTGVSATHIIFGVNTNATLPPSTFNPGVYYCFLDEFSIIPVPGASFTIPNNTVCTSAGITNLAQFTGTTPGSFAGPGVTFDGTQYYFNSPATLSPGVYGISFTYSATSCMNTIYHSVVVENCCNSASIPSIAVTSVTGSPAWVGPKRIVNSFTVHPTGSLMMNGEFLISPNVSITVRPYAQLILIGAHLYGCLEMWKGIVIEDGGKVIAQSYQGVDNLIEDAETAITIPYNTNIQIPLYISRTTFNKNYVDVDMSNYPLANVLTSPFNECVFTCRDLPFTSTSWPAATTASNGLRFASSVTATPLASPYQLLNAPLAQLKTPHAGKHSHIAIKLSNVGRTNQNGPAPHIFYHPDLTPANGFNLYDGHDYFIKSVNSNVKISKSVFQNTQTFTVSSTPTVGAAVDYSCSTLTTYTPNSTIHNFELDMSAANVANGNKFYDCHRAVYGNNPFSFKLDNASVRSTHAASDATNTAVISTGQSGVFMRTNQMEDYLINNNTFFNITDGVAISLYPENIMRDGFPYYPGPPQQYFMINAYIHTLSVMGNTFSPEDNITFSGGTTGYVKNPISVVSDNYGMTGGSCGCSGIHIENNQIYRTLNGVLLNAVNPYTMTCKNMGTKKIIRNNVITLEEDNVFGGIVQHGIEFTNSLSEPFHNGQRLQTVEGNTITVFSGSAAMSNLNISLYYGTGNGGTGKLYPTPHILCNDLSYANRGFVFENHNRPASWRGNKMKYLMMGMVLTGTASTGGVIGQQGSPKNPIDNQWNGSWTGSNYGTWVDQGSSAVNSKLYTRSGTPWAAPNNFGSAGAPARYSAATNTIITNGSYECGAAGNYTIMESDPPTPGPITDVPWYISATFSYRYLEMNDSMRNSDGGLLEFYNSLAGTSIDLFMDVEMLIGQRRFNEAAGILGAIGTDGFNSAELAYHSFYSLNLKYKAGDENFSPDDVIALTDLAALCPATYGSLVFQARSLYQLVTAQVYSGPDGCNTTGERRALQATDQPGAESKLPWNVSLFPNPSDGNFAIICNEEKEAIRIRITDLWGRELYRYTAETRDHVHVAELSLPNGAYFIDITNRLHGTVTKKLVIAR